MDTAMELARTVSCRGYRENGLRMLSSTCFFGAPGMGDN